MRRGCTGAIACIGGLACAAAAGSRASSAREEPFDACVVGGGVVGLAVARECAVRGARVCVVEKEESLASGASSGNSGLGCTGYDAPVGSLERQLLRRSIQRHQHLYRSFGLSHDHVRKCGSLVVAWTPEQLAELVHIIAENREGGDEEATLLTQNELRELEPALSRDAMGAVLCPYEAVVEPWLVPIAYAESARLHGAAIFTSTAVVGAAFDARRGVWRLDVVHDAARRRVPGRSAPGRLLVDPPSQPTAVRSRFGGRAGWSDQLEKAPLTIAARVVINCAGLHGDTVDALRFQRGAAPSAEGVSPAFTIVPRKGEFSFIYRYLVRESCSQFDSPPLTY